MLLRIEKVNEDFVIRDAVGDHVAGEIVGRPFASSDSSHHEFGILRSERCTTRLPTSASSPWPNPLEKALMSAGFYELTYPWRERRTRHGVIGARRMPRGWVVRLNSVSLMDNDTGWAAEFPTRVLAERAAKAQASEARQGREFQRNGFYWEQGTDVPLPLRIEHRLGHLLADATSLMARAAIEHQGGGVTADTRKKIGEVIAHLEAIWFASRFGAYRAEARVFEPYFAGDTNGDARMSFAAAVQHYGMAELRRRFPGLSEAALRAASSCPLELLRSTVLSLRAPSAALQMLN